MILVSRNIRLNIRRGSLDIAYGTPNDNGVLEILDAQTFPSKFPSLKPTLLYSNTKQCWVNYFLKVIQLLITNYIANLAAINY